MTAFGFRASESDENQIRIGEALADAAYAMTATRYNLAGFLFLRKIAGQDRLGMLFSPPLK